MKVFLKNSFIVTVAVMITVMFFKTSYSITDTLKASLDNTLYENAFGETSNGKGQFIFSGMTLGNEKRRAVISFNVGASIPPGAVVTGVKLILHMSKTISGSSRVDLHKITGPWGEGNSAAFGEEGRGTFSETGDATWIHRFYDNLMWTSEGGDFEATESASSNVNGVGFYEWTGAQMTTDVQNWINNQSANDYGWLLLNNEAVFPTAKRFDSRENNDSTVRPRLVVTYTFNKIALRMTALTEGFVQGPIVSASLPASYPDTFRVYLRSSIAPYSVVDSSKAYSSSTAWYVFNNAPAGSYYIMASQRNSINTWSKLPQAVVVGKPYPKYNFTTAVTQAYGNNLVLKDSAYCFYSGDVNKDNFVNLTDVILVYNASVTFLTGYVVTDVNGDSIVDLTDILITYNNSTKFVQQQRP